MRTTKPLSALVQSFFAVALPQRGLSPLTALSYRDAMKLLLRYATTRTGRPVVKLDVADVTPELVSEFLAHLEAERGNQIATRNNRLAALRTFFAYVATEEPALAEQCRRICAIPLKRAPTRTIPYLEQDEMDALLVAPNRTSRLGRFHYAIVLFLYNTGARVAELVGVRAADLRLDGLHPQVLLRGKGKKERICPLWQDTVSVLHEHLAEIGIAPDSDERIFLNRRAEPLTRYGVNYILGVYAKKATVRVSSIADKRVSPHTIRHTTAVHLLNAGVDIDVIRAWLGHVDVRTTNIYVEINLATKRRALEMCVPRIGEKPPGWKRSPDILAWLEAM
jgi:site-specific recombinase XerD